MYTNVQRKLVYLSNCVYYETQRDIYQIVFITKHESCVSKCPKGIWTHKTKSKGLKGNIVCCTQTAKGCLRTTHYVSIYRT